MPPISTTSETLPLLTPSCRRALTCIRPDHEMILVVPVCTFFWQSFGSFDEALRPAGNKAAQDSVSRNSAWLERNRASRSRLTPTPPQTHLYGSLSVVSFASCRALPTPSIVAYSQSDMRIAGSVALRPTCPSTAFKSRESGDKSSDWTYFQILQHS